jgi:hypothetical protein
LWKVYTCFEKEEVDTEKIKMLPSNTESQRLYI